MRAGPDWHDNSCDVLFKRKGEVRPGQEVMMAGMIQELFAESTKEQLVRDEEKLKPKCI